jgi:hypothetical protein
MASSPDAVRSYLKKLGLEPSVADVYLALHAYGPQSISQLSRSSGVERTRIYRLLDLMQEATIIEVEIHNKRSVVKAADIGNLQSLLSKREQELRSLEKELHQLENSFSRSTISSNQTKVHFYPGLDGNKQMFWNQTHATTEVLSILYQHMQNKTNNAFFERWVRKCNEQDLRFRALVSQDFIKTQRTWFATYDSERLKHWRSRYIDRQIFPISHSVVTYDDVVAYYNWKNGEIFCIEVHNQEIANSQRVVFDLLWKQSAPIDALRK